MIQISNAVLNKDQQQALNTLSLGEYLFNTDSLLRAHRMLQVEQSLVGTPVHKKVTFVASEQQVLDRMNEILEQHGQKTIQEHSRISIPHLVW